MGHKKDAPPRLLTFLYTLVDQAVHSGTNFLTGVLVGRFLSIGEFGVFSLGMTTLVLSLVVQDTLLATPYTYYYHHKPAEQRNRLKAAGLVQSLILSLLFCCFFVLVSFGFDVFIADEQHTSSSLALIFLALGLSMPFLFVREFFRRLFFAEFSMKHALILDIFASIMQFSFLWLLFGNALLSPPMVFGAMAAASGFCALVCFLVTRKTFSFRGLSVLQDMKEYTHYGRWLLAGSAFHLGSIFAYPWVLYIFHGEEGTGAFAACFSIINLMNPLLLGFTNFFRPKMIQVYAQEGLTALNKLILSSCALMLVPMLLVLSILGLWGEDILRLVYGEAFSGLSVPIRLLSLSLLALAVTTSVQLGALALNAPQLNPAFHFASFVVTVFVGVPLVKTFGLTGAAAGFSLSVFAGMIALVFLYLRLSLRKSHATLS